MIKLISAIFSAGVVVGVAIALRRRRATSTTEQPIETVDHLSHSDHRSNDEAAEPEEPVTVPAQRR